MQTSTPEGQVQIDRITDFLRGEGGQTAYERLSHYAECENRRYALRSSWISQSGDDFLNETVRSCITLREDGYCERQIPENVPLHAALRQIIKSKVEHAYQSLGSRRRARPPATTYESGGGASIINEPTEQFWIAEGDRMTAQEREEAAKRIDALIAFAKSDRVVYGMLILVRDESLDKPASLVAKRLGISEDEVYVARKRLATLTGKFLKLGRAT